MLGQRLTRQLAGGGPMIYWATLEPRDTEDRAIVRRHLAERDGWGFQTLERGRELPRGLAAVPPESAVLFDSVTACLACQMFSGPSPDAAAPERTAEELLADWTGGAVLLLETGGRGSGVSQRLEAARVRLSQAGIPCIQRRADAARLNESLSGLLRETEARWVMTFGPLATAQAAAGKETSGWTQPLYGAGVTMRVATALERGTVTAAVAWSDYAAGYLAVQGAAQAARGQEPAEEAVPFLVVRGDEIYAPENEKLLFPVTY